MTLDSLSLYNFKRYKEFEINFDEGLYGILGRNGSGKSTIFEGIFFALYGEYRGSKELLRNSGSTENIRVVLDFTLDGHTYSVSREFRGKSLTAYASLKKAENSIANGAKEVTQTISRLLGMRKDAFLHTVFASQKELTALSSMKNDARKSMMRRLLGLEKIDRIEDMIKNSLREIKRDINAQSAYLLSQESIEKYKKEQSAKGEEQNRLEKAIFAMEKKEKELKTLYETLNKQTIEMQKERENLQKKKALLAQSLQKLDFQNRQAAELKDEINTLKKQKEQFTSKLPLKNEFEELERELKVQEQLKTAYLTRQGYEREYMQLRNEYKNRVNSLRTLRNDLEPFEDVKKTLSSTKKLLSSHKTSLKSIDEELRLKQNIIAASRAKISDINKRLKKIRTLGTDSPCPVCTRPLLDQYEQVIHTLQEEIEGIYRRELEKAESELKDLKGKEQKENRQITELEEKVQALDRKLTILKSKQELLIEGQKYLEELKKRGLAQKEALEKLGEISYDSQYHQKIMQRHSLLKPQISNLLKLEALIATIPDKEKVLEKLDKEISDTEKLIQERSRNVENDSYDPKADKELKTKLDALQYEREQFTEEQKMMLQRHTNIVRDIEAIEKELERDKKNRKSLELKEQERNDYEKLKVLTAEFKTHINAQVAPRISEIAGEMYNRITRGKYQHIEVSPEFDFYIYENGEKYPIERFSGGEIDLANLVLRISISQTLGELGGGNALGFLAFDEIFGSQDEERRMQIMDAFHTISESYRQIFLISHETEIKEMFERVIEL